MSEHDHCIATLKVLRRSAVFTAREHAALDYAIMHLQLLGAGAVVIERAKLSLYEAIEKERNEAHEAFQQLAQGCGLHWQSFNSATELVRHVLDKCVSKVSSP